MNSKVLLQACAMGLASLFFGSLAKGQNAQSIYDFKIRSLDGKVIDFSRYKGKKLLIVNTASKCAYTPQYADLQKLHENYSDKVVVLGFPSNDFLWQEPGSNQEINNFCQKNYGVTFQMFEKVEVKGRGRHPLYQWLKEKSGETPSWNFCKFLIDKNGEFVAFFNSKKNPLDQEIIDKINRE
ncbi:MAG: glutathione peroxidase [Bacteroidota bacterium]